MGAAVEEQKIELKVFQNRRQYTRFKKWKTDREAQLPKNMLNTDALNELIDFALDQKGY